MIASYIFPGVRPHITSGSLAPQPSAGPKQIYPSGKLQISAKR